MLGTAEETMKSARGPWIIVQLRRAVSSSAFTYFILGLLLVTVVGVGPGTENKIRT